MLFDILRLVALPEILLSSSLHILKLIVESRSASIFQDCLFNKVNVHVLLDCISLFCFDLNTMILNSLV